VEGRKRAIGVAVVALSRRGLLKVEDNGQTLRAQGDRPWDELDRAIWDAASQGEASLSQVHQAAEPVIVALESRLRAEGIPLKPWPDWVDTIIGIAIFAPMFLCPLSRAAPAAWPLSLPIRRAA